MFDSLRQINARPDVFQFYTASTLWDDEYTSQQMLKYHLDEHVDMSSRNSKFIESSSKWIASTFNLGTGSYVCDFGCGPGLYTARFAETGADVTGIDFSRNSIRYAKETAAEKNLGIDYRLQNYLEYRADKRFDLITMIMCDFCALSPNQRRDLLDIINTHLSENGSLLFDVYSETAYTGREESCTYEHRQLNGFWSPDDYYGFVNTFKYDENKVVLDKYTIVEESRTFEVYNWLQYFSPESLKLELEQSGLKVVEIYSDITGTPYNQDSPEFAVISRKLS